MASIEQRITQLAQAIGADMKVALSGAQALYLPVFLQDEQEVRIPLSVAYGLRVGLAAGGFVDVALEA